MAYYNITAEIHFDPNRTNSRYYATVTVEELVNYDLTRYQTLDVVLNGGGHSKARKKINRQLAFIGIRPERRDQHLYIKLIDKITAVSQQ